MIELYKDEINSVLCSIKDIVWQKDYNTYCVLGYVSLPAFI